MPTIISPTPFGKGKSIDEIKKALETLSRNVRSDKVGFWIKHRMLS